jgi:hypothetical protein
MNLKHKVVTRFNLCRLENRDGSRMASCTEETREVCFTELAIFIQIKATFQNSPWLPGIRIYTVYLYRNPTVWENQGTKNENKIRHLLKRNMTTRYESEWKKYISEESKKLKTYSTFKKNVVLEKYITLTSLEKRRDFTKLRISAHKLHIESGRYTLQQKKLCIVKIAKFFQPWQITRWNKLLMKVHKIFQMVNRT